MNTVGELRLNFLNRQPIFVLKLLGGASLEARDGPIAGRATQRHRLALLALLAIYGERGQTRERLMAYLWPERDTEHARQLLNQAVHSLRKTLGQAALLSAGDHLRLNPEVVSADVAELDGALARGNHGAAAALYRGPFLDGFFLPEAPEFERWTQGERDRLATAYAQALEALAEAAERERDRGRAVEWWKTRAAHDPYDSRVALRLMQALEAAGNRTGALQHAGIHERLLRAEFGVEPAAEVLALAERLRREPAVRAQPRPDGEAGNGAAALPPAARWRKEASPPALGSTEPPGAATAARQSATSPSSTADTTLDPAAHESPAPAPLVTAPRPPTRPRPAVWYSLAVFLLCAVLIAIWLGRTLRSTPPPTAREPAIAVLPLANHSTDPRDAALADGMTEELIAVLARAGSLRVVGSTSAFAFRNRQLDVRRIADSLGVAHLLEGDLQKSGSRLRVRVRLLDARDGSTRWSETYDRELRDVFAVQDDIARAVARELGLRLGAATGTPLRRRPTRNVAAYELYLRGSDRFLIRSDSGLRQGLEFFRQAIALDSTYAAAWAGLARMYNVLSIDAPGPVRTQYRALAEEAARKAVALDDSLAEAHQTLGAIRMYRLDFTSAEQHLTRALALDPSRALTHEVMVRLLLWTGRPAEALAHAERALEVDPLSPTAHAELARALLGTDRCDEALAELEKLSGLRPPLVRAAFIAAQCYAHKGRWPEAIAALRPQAERGDRQALGLLGYMLARAGQREEALRIHAALLEEWRRGAGEAFEVALVYAGLGDLDQTATWFDRAIADRSLGFALMRVGPLFNDVRGDPRFERLRERLGLQRR
ncbi:MAG: BTAD domain-containing putative transcriptional regulator [Gemmatimonadaceae bacterium]